MKLAVLGFAHESNTFAAHATTYADFERAGILRGPDVVEAHLLAGSSVSGFLAAASPDVTIAPLMIAYHNASGTMTRDAFERLADEMLATLGRLGPWDGVLLAQHGAAVAKGFPDADGEMVRRVRELVGPRVPVGVALDMHANLSRQLIDHSTAVVLYRTNPHADAKARALECATIIIRTARGEVRPVQALEAPPAAINILRQSTGAEPMLSIMAFLNQESREPGVLSMSFAEGFPYADVAEMGVAAVAVHDGDLAAASRHARRLATEAWRQRESFEGTASTPAEALEAGVTGSGLSVVLDVGDNIGGGGPGDSTVLLTEARQLGIRSLLAILFDPVAARACADAGIGSRVDIHVGARTDSAHGGPFSISGDIRFVGDGRWQEPGPTHGGRRYFDPGITAVVDTIDGHTIVLTERLTMPVSLGQFGAVGVQPDRYQIVIAKGVHSPRLAYERIAKRFIVADTPGVTRASITSLEYRHRRRPMFPFERDASYP